MRIVKCMATLWVVTLLMPAPAHADKVSNVESFSDSRKLATTLWYPEDVTTIRGVIVFTGGQGSGVSNDTRAFADNPFWQAFGESLDFALVGTQFTGSYTDASAGPGKALLDSLASLATQTGHPELANAPLLLEGFSNGGFFSYTFAAFAPDRVIAFCLNKSGYARAPLTAAFLAVPGLLIWGSEEPATGTPTVIHGLVQEGRKQHALWAELKEWGRQHEEGSVERVYAPFFADMVAARYPDFMDPRTGPVPLRALRESDGYLGDHSDASIETNMPKIAAYADYTGDKLAASWLPNGGIARLWRGFVTKNALNLTLPQPGQLIGAMETLQLSVSTLDDTHTGRFLDGATMLTQDVKPSNGTAQSAWYPQWGGVRGIVAVEVTDMGEVVRTTRPANIVIFGKSAPIAPGVQPPPSADAGVPSDAATPADPSAPDAGSSQAPAKNAADSGGRASSPAPALVLPPSTAGGSAALEPTHSADGVTTANSQGTRSDRGGLEGGCSTDLRAAHTSNPLVIAAGCIACVYWRRARALLRG
jgi:pimeloyl-ACP methyl ester carboxylesterase